MKHQRQFESTGAFREVAKTKMLISDLGRIIQILNVDIAAEEEQAGITNHFQPEYPFLARALIARRDNLMETISALQRRLDVT